MDQMGPERDEIAVHAADLWVPMPDLIAALNLLPGEYQTDVDVIRDGKNDQSMKTAQIYSELRLDTSSQIDAI